jgi:two-component system sensor histidine kinase KdpD
VNGLKASLAKVLTHPAAGYAASVVSVLLIALMLAPVYSKLRAVTAATALLMAVLLVAIRWGTGPALVSSILGAIYLNFYIVPPTRKFSFHLAAGDDLVALVAFLVTSISVGQLSARMQRKARENQRLYQQLRDSMNQQTQLEAMRQSDKLKSALLDTVTHDLRTPLTSIKAAASALMESQPKAEQAQSQQPLLQIIVQQADRLNHFIEGMLELARVEGGRLDARRVATPIEDILTAALVRAEDTLSNHIVTVDSPDGLSALVSPKAVAQVVFSLVENAAKYSPAGTNIRVSASSKSATDLLIAVEDEGPGVPVDLRERIFEKFFRQDDSSGMHKSGMGLGLAIARGIVEGHGGRIWVEGANGSGARFVFTLPGVVTAQRSSEENQKT